MKIKMNPAKMKALVQSVKPARGGDVHEFIQSFYCLAADKNTFRIAAYNDVIGIERICQCFTEREGRICIPGSVLEELLRDISKFKGIEEITLTVDHDSAKLSWESGGSINERLIPELKSADQFPNYALEKPILALTIERHKMLGLLNAVLCMANSSKYLTQENDCIFFEFKENTAFAGATDIETGDGCVGIALTSHDSVVPIHFALTSSASTMLLDLLKNSSGNEVHIYINDSNQGVIDPKSFDTHQKAMFQADGFNMVCPLLSVKTPKNIAGFKDSLPNRSAKVVNLKQLEEGVTMAASISKDPVLQDCVRFTFTFDELTIRAALATSSEIFKKSIPCKSNFEGEIIVNADQLKLVFESIATEYVEVGVLEDNSFMTFVSKILQKEELSILQKYFIPSSDQKFTDFTEPKKRSKKIKT